MQKIAKRCIFRRWRRRRDLNPRDAFNAYTISNRAPSAGLGDFSKKDFIAVLKAFPLKTAFLVYTNSPKFAIFFA